MPQNFIPRLANTDWNEEWKELQKARRHADDAAFWDMRAKTFSTKDSPNPYVERFLELSGIEEGETAFDMGCGTGALSLPLGRRGHRVVAADFSQGMLGVLEEDLAAEGITGVETKLMSWEDDWTAHGVTEKSADLAFASRSIATADLKDSLLKLHAVARRRSCITLPTGSSPRMDERLFDALGIRNAYGHDYLYAFNILANEGLRPEVAYISSPRKDTFDTIDEAFGDFSRMITDFAGTLTEAEQEEAAARLRGWLEEHAVKNPDAGMPDPKGLAQKAYCLDKPRMITWAFIAWNKEP